MFYVSLTFDQFRVIQQKLPLGYNLQRRYKNMVQEDEMLEESQADFESSMQKGIKVKRSDSFVMKVSLRNQEDLRTCQNILTKIKKTGSFKLLTTEDAKETYNKYFAKMFQKLEQFYKNIRNESLLGNDFIVARFWNDFHALIKSSQLQVSKDPKMYQATLEMENQFNSIFIPNQQQCLEQSANMQLAKIEAQLKGQSHPYIGFNKLHHKQSLNKSRILTGPKEYEEMQGKLSKLPKYNQKILYDLVGNLINENNELDLNQIDPFKFNQLQSYFKRKQLKFKRVKLAKRARKSAKQGPEVEAPEYNEYSNLSFLSSSDDE